jgi:hypothetical protein
MSTEYRNRFMTKVMAEFTQYIRGGGGYTGAEPYLKHRMKHYGMLNRYLPPDFKKDDVVKALESDSNDNSKSLETTTSNHTG